MQKTSFYMLETNVSLIYLNFQPWYKKPLHYNSYTWQLTGFKRKIALPPENPLSQEWPHAVSVAYSLDSDFTNTTQALNN